jgi:hypothetical protein
MYTIGSPVYHVTRESEEGIVLDIMHTYSTNEIEYLVAFSWRTEEQVICKERELSLTKCF